MTGQNIHVTAAACSLGQAIYYLRAQAFGFGVVPWEDAPAATQHEFVERAGQLLEEYRPAPRRSFDYLGLVVGAISPEQPFGETR